MPIGSIEKVGVSAKTDVLPFNRENIDSITEGYGVYLIFSGPSDSFAQRDYCKIGRAAGRTPNLRQRLFGNLRYHDGSKRDECQDGANHSFQVLYCDSPTQAARLEALFHLWHGGYQHAERYNPRMPIEPKGRPSTKLEADFLEIRA